MNIFNNNEEYEDDSLLVICLLHYILCAQVHRINDVI